MVGSIFQVLVEPGATVNEEQELIVLESMKMEIPVASPKSGKVKEVKVKVGDSVQEGDILVVLD
jgi:acetyl-CoA carboxylase biotin carboxyl carrier protein